MTTSKGPVAILGAAGQDGRYLAEAHRRRGDRVLCFSRRSRDDIAELDVADRTAITELIRRERPAVVYQLAAVSSTRHEALWDNQSAIVDGTLNVLEAAFAHSRETAVMVIGSALQFENRGEPIRETDPFAAASAYALARIQAAYAARYFRSKGLRAYVGYLFHHESPERCPPHVSARICRDVAAIARGQADVLEVGDPRVEKEWGYAGDVADALIRMVEQSEVFEAVVGTGEAHSIREWAERCFARAGLSPADRIRALPDFRAEYPRIVSSPETLRRLNWTPRMRFEELADQMMTRALELNRGVAA
jgi:GDPmannose 4,6-dehydratase